MLNEADPFRRDPLDSAVRCYALACCLLPAPAKISAKAASRSKSRCTCSAPRCARQRCNRCASRGNYSSCYWTPAQLVAHHTSNGCNLKPGDLVGSGTLSGSTPASVGSLLELTQGGKASVQLPTGEARTFIEDGDEVKERRRRVADGGVSASALARQQARSGPPAIVDSSGQQKTPQMV